MGPIGYMLLTGTSSEQLSQKVCDSLKEGYVVHGSPGMVFGPFSGDVWYFQAVIKK